MWPPTEWGHSRQRASPRVGRLHLRSMHTRPPTGRPGMQGAKMRAPRRHSKRAGARRQAQQPALPFREGWLLAVSALPHAAHGCAGAHRTEVRHFRGAPPLPRREAPQRMGPLPPAGTTAVRAPPSSSRCIAGRPVGGQPCNELRSSTAAPQRARRRRRRRAQQPALPEGKAGCWLSAPLACRTYGTPRRGHRRLRKENIVGRQSAPLKEGGKALPPAGRKPRHLERSRNLQGSSGERLVILLV